MIKIKNKLKWESYHKAIRNWKISIMGNGKDDKFKKRIFFNT